jgi:hypothetical protein
MGCEESKQTFDYLKIIISRDYMQVSALINFFCRAACAGAAICGSLGSAK